MLASFVCAPTSTAISSRQWRTIRVSPNCSDTRNAAMKRDLSASNVPALCCYVGKVKQNDQRKLYDEPIERQTPTEYLDLPTPGSQGRRHRCLDNGPAGNGWSEC